MIALKLGVYAVLALKQVIIAESARHRDAEDSLIPDEIEDPGRSEVESSHSEVLNTIPDEAMHRVTAMAARLFSAPISIVIVVDHDRIWFKSRCGADVEAVARAVDLSKVQVPQDQTIVMEDAMLEPRAQESDLVSGLLGPSFLCWSGSEAAQRTRHRPVERAGLCGRHRVRGTACESARFCRPRDDPAGTATRRGAHHRGDLTPVPRRSDLSATQTETNAA